MTELSIIVPVYKVEKYLPKCIDSILAQTFTDFELILIDDGSPDRCGDICDEYAAKDDRIIVIHQENKGVSAARNAGLDIARGEYIGFVDSDDWIEPEMYETMLATAKESEAEIVACGANHSDETETILFQELLEDLELYNDKMLAELFRLPNRFGGCIWNKLYKTSVAKSVRFQSGVKMAEDRLYLFDCYCKSKKGIKISPCMYWVREHLDSATHSKSLHDCSEMLTSSLRMMHLSKKHSELLYSKAADKFLDDCLIHIHDFKRFRRKFPFLYIYYTLKFKLLMYYTIIGVAIHHQLPVPKIRGYLWEGIRV